MICFNADVCVVEVEINTGRFKVLKWLTSEDVGNVINPMIVDGQMHGAIVQGLSNAIFEEFVYNEQGQQMTADFEHYKLATAADVPDIEVTYASTPCPHTPLGTRGIGEGGRARYRAHCATRSAMRWRRSTSRSPSCRFDRTCCGRS